MNNSDIIIAINDLKILKDDLKQISSNKFILAIDKGIKASKIEKC